MKKPFAVGDRVRIYETFSRGGNAENPISCNGRGKIIFILKNGVLQITTDFGSNTYAHPKQCRRLKPKASQPYELDILIATANAGQRAKARLWTEFSDQYYTEPCLEAAGFPLYSRKPDPRLARIAELETELEALKKEISK